MVFGSQHLPLWHLSPDVPQLQLVVPQPFEIFEPHVDPTVGVASHVNVGWQHLLPWHVRPGAQLLVQSIVPPQPLSSPPQVAPAGWLVGQLLGVQQLFVFVLHDWPAEQVVQLMEPPQPSGNDPH